MLVEKKEKILCNNICSPKILLKAKKMNKRLKCLEAISFFFFFFFFAKMLFQNRLKKIRILKKNEKKNSAKSNFFREI